jgi:hypothetical protein
MRSHPISCLSSDKEQRKNTRLSWVESLMGMFTLPADFKNDTLQISDSNANQ